MVALTQPIPNARYARKPLRRPSPEPPPVRTLPRPEPAPTPSPEPLRFPTPTRRELPPAALLAWAHGALYSRLVKRARTLLWAHETGTDDDAEDIVAAAFVAIAGKLCHPFASCIADLPRTEAELTRWLFARVRWACLNAEERAVREGRTWGVRVRLVMDADEREHERGSVIASELPAPDVELPAPPRELPGMRFSARMCYALSALSAREAGMVVAQACDGVARAGLVRRYPVSTWSNGHPTHTTRATRQNLATISRQLSAAKERVRAAYAAHTDVPDGWQPSARDAARCAVPVEPDPREEQARQAALPWWCRDDDEPLPRRRKRKTAWQGSWPSVLDELLGAS